MIKQTNAQETLKRGKGKYKGDEDNLKSSTQNPEKELIENFISNIEDILQYVDKRLIEKKDTNYLEILLLTYAFLNQVIRSFKKILLTKFDSDF